MPRFLLDSNALTALANRREPVTQNARTARRRGHPIGTCDPVVAEMYYGLNMSTSRPRSVALFELALRTIKTRPLTREASREYGRIAADLKRRGQRIQVIDTMIAAIALTLGNCTVVTTDSDFARIPGLDVIDWTLPPPPEPAQS